MKHPKIKVYCKNCQKRTFAKIVTIAFISLPTFVNKVFGCECCLTAHLSATGKFIEDYTILCKNYNVEWPIGKQAENV